MIFEQRKPDMLYQQATNQLNLAFASKGPDRDRLLAAARETIDRLKLLPAMAAKSLVLEGQELHAKGTTRKLPANSTAHCAPTRTWPPRACCMRRPYATPSAATWAAPPNCWNGRFNLMPPGWKTTYCWRKSCCKWALRRKTSPRTCARCRHPPRVELAADLALRGGRFDEAAETYGVLNPLATLPKRAEALRALGHPETAHRRSADPAARCADLRPARLRRLPGPGAPGPGIRPPRGAKCWIVPLGGGKSAGRPGPAIEPTTGDWRRGGANAWSSPKFRCCRRLGRLEQTKLGRL